MRRALLISLSLVLALGGWSAVGAEDGFYVIPAMRGNYAPVPMTGQTSPNGTGSDGDLQKGVAWPTPRFTDNNNGTVTDKLTGLIWMKNANAFGKNDWQGAFMDAGNLQSGQAGLTDGSTPGDWRLPNLQELQSLIDYRFSNPALPDTVGTGQWEQGNPFQGVMPYLYWSSTTHELRTTTAWCMNFDAGIVTTYDKGTVWFGGCYVWPVRGGQ